ncbi:MliC family protein [Methylobacterium pseudosasicola]|uniref:Membrane-bound inhibitor of C-type lysozyme n=1 Tax=Methylobacterium pseudosasicola TaxID=582667 RepID=A0A1I4GS33_9HYPH|nr:MliC family protein [Methylobacterium pseudosasicola]SFL32719.1 Membrane-bound inhibitor of C-type lysozyme [Methylobacterium pseudosasicola]
MRRIAQALCLLFEVSAWTGTTRALAAEEPAQAQNDMARPEPAQPHRVVFSCPRDQTLSVAFVTVGQAEQAVVQPPSGPSVTLPIKPSGSGFRYADETHELRGKGQEVIWTDASKRPIVCTEQMSAPSGTAPR